MRNIIQITATVDSDDAQFLYALCDDGTIWYRVRSSIKGWTDWVQLEGIPRR